MLYKDKDAIEEAFGNSLEWKELPEYKLSVITFELSDVNLYDENDWLAMNEFIVYNLPKFEEAFKPFIKNLR